MKASWEVCCMALVQFFVLSWPECDSSSFVCFGGGMGDGTVKGARA